MPFHYNFHSISVINFIACNLRWLCKGFVWIFLIPFSRITWIASKFTAYIIFELEFRSMQIWFYLKINSFYINAWIFYCSLEYFLIVKIKYFKSINLTRTIYWKWKRTLTRSGKRDAAEKSHVFKKNVSTIFDK